MFKKLFIFLFCFMVFSLFQASFAATKIQSAQIEINSGYDTITIKTSDYVVPEVKFFSDKILVDFPGSSAKLFKNNIDGSPRVSVIRSGQFKPDVARVVVEVKGKIKYEIASRYGKNDVILEVSGACGIAKVKPTQQILPKKLAITFETMQKDIVSKEVTSKKLTAEVLANEKSVESQTIKGSITIKVLSPVKDKTEKDNKILKGKLIVVDPGHGGSDPGAFGLGGIMEKDLTLQTAMYLVKFLKRNGAKVFLTRKSDERKSLEEVADYTNKIKADVYIGMHYNSLDRPMSGTETYYYTPQSFRLASLVQKSMVLNLKRQDHGVKQGMFYTIHHAEMPAIIVEPVYLTDPEEGLLAKSMAFQKEVALSITEGIKDYFSR